MKRINLANLIAAFALLFSVNAFAQFDDLYYDPSTDGSTEEYYESDDSDFFDDKEDVEEDYSYDDDNYEYFDDYNSYQYTSRIRRFNRPYYGFNYYDPIYVDAGYYDPFVSPYAYGRGTTVLIYGNPYSYNNSRRFNRFNRFNRWNSFNRWNDPFFNDPWRSPFRNNGFGGGNFYGASPAFGGGALAGSNYYCPPSYGSGITYNTSGTQNYYGSRRSNTVRNSGSNGTRSGNVNTRGQRQVLGKSRGSVSNGDRTNARTPRTTTRSSRGTYKSDRSSTRSNRTYRSNRSSGSSRPSKSYSKPSRSSRSSGSYRSSSSRSSSRSSGSTSRSRRGGE